MHNYINLFHKRVETTKEVASCRLQTKELVVSVVPVMRLVEILLPTTPQTTQHVRFMICRKTQLIREE